jgi:hypothetical protein
MGIVYADRVWQPGEEPRFEIKYTPGKVIATGDTLTGDPTVKVWRMSDGTDVTADIAGPPAISGVLKGTPSRSGNSVIVQLQNLIDGEKYDVQSKCNTTNGEVDIEIDLIVECRALP